MITLVGDMEQIGRVLSPTIRNAAPDLALSIQRDAIEFYVDLSTIEQVGVALAAALIVGSVVLGILPTYSKSVVRTARRSPVISILMGVPGTIVIVFFLYLASVISGDSLGVFFAIPLVSIGLTLLPAWTALAMVAVGCSIGNRVGRDGLLPGLLIGTVLIGLSAARLELVVGVVALLASLGVGAGFRVLIGSGTGTDPAERRVPPANQI